MQKTGHALRVLRLTTLFSTSPLRPVRFLGWAPATLGGLLLLAPAACSPEGGDNPDGSGGSAPSGGASGSGGATASGGAASSDQGPADSSQAAIAAFIQAGTYKSWLHDPAPRVGGPSNVHGDALQVYFNDLAVAAGVNGEPDPGGMVVKEMYDEGTGDLVSIAAALTTTGKRVYFCTNPAGGLCTNGSETSGPDPVYDATENTSCSTCHSELVYSKLPE